MDVKTIIIGGVENEVVRYSEETDSSKEAIIINCIVKVAEDDRKKMADSIGDNRYFTVIRPDISNDPLTMRFGATSWSQHDGFIKRSMVLVEKCYDNENENELPIFPHYDLQIDNLVIELSKQISYSKSLEKLLVSKSIINDKDVIAIRNESENNYLDETRRFYKVDDVEKYS